LHFSIVSIRYIKFLLKYMFTFTDNRNNMYIERDPFESLMVGLRMSVTGILFFLH
jgi:hypothetical protein